MSNTRFKYKGYRPILLKKYSTGHTWLGSLGAALMVAALSGCGSLPPPQQPKPNLAEEIFDSVPGRLNADQANDVTLYALGLVGTPYRYGGNTPETGFDCSGLISHVYQSRATIKPPRTTAELSFWGHSIPAEVLQTGDLVLFGKSTVATHAGIYVGGGRFVHAPSTGGTVRLERMDARYWQALNPRFRRP